MSSTCFEPQSSSSGRQLYMQVWCSVFYMHQYKQYFRWSSVLGTDIAVSKYAEDTKN